MKVGIIGCGLIGNKRAQSIKDTHQIVMVCDIDKKLSSALAKQCNAKAVTNWIEVIKSDVDIIIIATPHNLLSEITLQALAAHKHVLVEKPAGISADELIPIAKLAEKNSLLVKVGFNHRFHPAIQKAHHLYKSGLIGNLLCVRARYGHGGRIGYEKEWRCDAEISGGGELIDQGSHLIDLARWFIGDLKLDYADTPTYFWDIKVDDNCFIALKSKQNQMAWLHASWSEWKNTFCFEIYGKTGKLQIDGLGGSYGTEKLTIYNMLPQMGPPDTTIIEYPKIDNSWELEFNEFVTAITERKSPCGNIYDAIEMHKIIADCYNFNSKKK